jgi:hypothetical protein
MVKNEEKKQENLLRFDSVSKEQFVSFISKNKEDKFAKTFVAKCDMLNRWDEVVGLWEGDDLSGAILTTVSVRTPYVANLQLLHTFHKHRKKGIAKLLCQYSLLDCYLRKGADYMRVSSEIPAIPFYKKLGIQFVGKQKSGCLLAMFKLNAHRFEEIDYSLDDVIYKAATKKGKGGCIELFAEYKGLDIFAE